jgi:hypothetical protein
MSRLQWFVAFAAALGGSAASAATVWVAPAAQKIRPQTLPPSGATAAAELAAAQNEFESFQVVVTGVATSVSMSLEALADGNGHVISGRDVTLYREALITVTAPTGGDGATGVWPDALVPDVDPIVGEKRNAFPFNVPNGESRAVFVDIHVPATLPAGTYTGTLNVTGGITAQVPVALTVWDFSMPSTATLKSSYGMTWNGPCMGHGDGSCSNATYEQQLRARYIQAALDNRISINQPTYQWSLQTAGSGTTGSWSDYDTYAGPYLSGTANTRLAGARLTSVRIEGEINSTAVLQGWTNHFAANGWTNALFAYECDEPQATCTWSQLSSRLNTASSAAPSLPRLVTTSYQNANAAGLASGITLFTPVIDQMENRPGTSYAGSQRSLYPATVWWYQSCDSFGCAAGTDVTGWPTMAIDSDATRNRALEWLSFSYDIAGELYYETTMAFFNGDAWVNPISFGGAGDGSLFYPGTSAKIGGSTEIPVESFRMKMIRDGMEDYELLALAKQLGLGDQAKQIAKSVYAVTYQATTTPAALQGARAQLAQMILHALGKDVTAPPPSTDGGTTGGGSGSTGGSADGGTTTTGSGSSGSGAGAPAQQPDPPAAASLGFPHAGCSGVGASAGWVGALFAGLLAMRTLRRRH